MFGIIVGTHGNLAEEIVRSCEMICGEQRNVKAVAMVPGESMEDAIKKYEKAIQELSCEEGVIFLNDLFGGSPYNAACQLAVKHEDYGIVTGVNLPMLIEMATAQMKEGADVKGLLDQAIEAGKNGQRGFHASFLTEGNCEK